MQSELTFYRNPATPIFGVTPTNNWQSPGAALSASAVRIYPGKAVLSATWVVAWNPNAGPTYNALRLVAADDGPSNIQPIAFLNAKEKMTPIVQAYDITDAVNTIMSSQSSRHLIMQSCGDTVSQIYRSTIDLVWADE